MKVIKLVVMNYLKLIIIGVVLSTLSGCGGTTTEKIYVVSDQCNKCDGEGKSIIECDHCNGTGTQWSNYDAGTGDRKDCIICVKTFCGHNTQSHEQDGISFSDDCANHAEKGAKVGQVYGDCLACDGKGHN